MLETGMKAPEFKLQDQNGREVSLSDFKGKKVILFFYSKDMTAGCTSQAQAYAELYPQFEAKNAVVIGISKDSVASHKKFEEKYSLPYILLSDPEKEVLSAYDVWKEKNMYGKKVMGVVRSSVIIDEEGNIEKVFTKVKAKENAGETLEALR